MPGMNAGDVRVKDTILDPTPDQITKLGIARTFQNIRLCKSMTVFENVLTAKHLRAKQNIFTRGAPHLNRGGGRGACAKETMELLEEQNLCACDRNDLCNVSAVRQAAAAGDRPRACDRARSFSCSTNRPPA